MKKFYNLRARTDTIRVVEPHKIYRCLNFFIEEVEVLYFVAKTKALICCAVPVHLIWAFFCIMPVFS